MWCSYIWRSALDQKNSFWVNLVKKVKIISLKLKFSISFDHKYLSLANLTQEFKIICSNEMRYKNLFEYAEFIGGVCFICFRLKIVTLFGKFGPKNAISPRDFEILGWCPAGPVLPHGEKVRL